MDVTYDEFMVLGIYIYIYIYTVRSRYTGTIGNEELCRYIESAGISI